MTFDPLPDLDNANVGTADITRVMHTWHSPFFIIKGGAAYEGVHI